MCLVIPQKYETSLGIIETQQAIKDLKDFFENRLGERLKLTRVSSPLFVLPETGTNDNLNGVEKPVSFQVPYLNKDAEIVHSLAKWKRMALKKYGFSVGRGLYTDMNAIRKDEELDNLHSLYVDQWDWELVINKEDRTKETLQKVVKTLYKVFKETEEHVHNIYPEVGCELPEEITFITSQELEDLYPNLTPKERENAICKKYKAVFIQGIGDILKSGEKHDGRSPDYDDWTLNGDILFYDPLFDSAIELSSMGIRVDKEALISQLKKANCEDRCTLPFHKALLEDKLPLTMGGGIGHSRICMYFLRKAHIGEVQASIWDEYTHKKCEEAGIELL